MNHEINVSVFVEALKIIHKGTQTCRRIYNYMQNFYKFNVIKSSAKRLFYNFFLLSKLLLRISVKGEITTAGKIQIGVPQGSVLSPAWYRVYINVFFQKNRHVCKTVCQSCLYKRRRSPRGLLYRNLQPCCTSTETWCELWFIKLINIRFSVVLSLLKQAHSMLTLKGRKIYFLNHIKYLVQSST
jgi:hypothetical protein